MQSTELAFDALENEWRLFSRQASVDLGAWESEDASIVRDQQTLVAAGLWVSGPADVLSILDLAGNELSHSAMMAWLLTPTRRHGFGDRILRELLELVWPDLPSTPGGADLVRREIPRADPGSEVETRADIVIERGDSWVIIGNKVWAAEGPDQCERLCRAWADVATDVRFLFVSPTGCEPS